MSAPRREVNSQELPLRSPSLSFVVEPYAPPSATKFSNRFFLRGACSPPFGMGASGCARSSCTASSPTRFSFYRRPAGRFGCLVQLLAIPSHFNLLPLPNPSFRGVFLDPPVASPSPFVQAGVSPHSMTTPRNEDARDLLTAFFELHSVPPFFFFSEKGSRSLVVDIQSGSVIDLASFVVLRHPRTLAQYVPGILTFSFPPLRWKEQPVDRFPFVRKESALSMSRL